MGIYSSLVAFIAGILVTIYSQLGDTVDQLEMLLGLVVTRRKIKL